MIPTWDLTSRPIGNRRDRSLDDGLLKPVKTTTYVPYTLEVSVFTQIIVLTRSAPLTVLNRMRRRRSIPQRRVKTEGPPQPMRRTVVTCRRDRQRRTKELGDSGFRFGKA